MPLIEIKSATITKKGQIAIPKYIRLAKGFKEGNKIAVLAFDDRVELRPMKQINEKIKIFSSLQSSSNFINNEKLIIIKK